MSNDNSSQWFKKKSKAHESIFQYIKQLDSAQSHIQLDNVKNMRLYGNHEYMGGGNYMRNSDSSVNTQNRVTLNIVQSMVDTAVSKIFTASKELILP